jgi:antitoxin component YwqK of YwqJK toxin-antitoxin module
VLNGDEEGVAGSWYADGQVKESYRLGHGYHGPVKKWHPNGQQKEEEGLYEFGIWLRSRQWDESRKLTRDFHLGRARGSCAEAADLGR